MNEKVVGYKFLIAGSSVQQRPKQHIPNISVSGIRFSQPRCGKFSQNLSPNFPAIYHVE